MSYQDLKECKIITAFITPFHEDGSINFDAIPALIEHLLAHHTDGILLAGTTAESPTLTHDEELELFAAVQKIVNGRVPLIAGVGTNDTRTSLLKKGCTSTLKPLQMLLTYLLLSITFQGVWLSN